MKTRWIAAVTLAAALALAACNPAAGTPTPAAATDLPLAATPTEPGQAATTAPPDATEAPTEPGAPTEPAPDTTDTPPATVAANGGGPVDPGGYTFVEVAAGFISPVLVTHAGDGSGRLFVVEKIGTIRIVAADGTVRPEPFYDMQGQVAGASEQGLLGLAFSPDYAEDGTFFINYTDLDGHTHVDRCLVADDDANRAGECSTVIIIEQPAWNHNGGHLAFGPDGYLYIGMGDGGGGNDPEDRAQDLNDLLGKLLRLEVSGDEAPYTAAPGNPFFGQGEGRAEIWAYGLRNPWRFSFDRATGDLYLGDVGQNAFEELNYQPASSAGGENYGWPYLEALRVNTQAPRAAPDGFVSVPPLLSYAQEVGGCSIVGGYVYRGAALPELNGTYFFSDYCSGQVWAIPAATPNPTVTPWMATGVNVSSFGEDEAGELYVVSLGGAIYRLVRGG